MSHLHHIAARFREPSLPDELRAPSVNLDDLDTIESDGEIHGPSLKDEDIDVKTTSFFRATNASGYSGPNETMHIPAGRSAGFEQVSMPKPLAQRLLAEERAGVELGKLRIYAHGTPQERRFLIFPRQDGSGNDDVYELAAQTTPASAGFIVATQLIKQGRPTKRSGVPPSSNLNSFHKREPDSDAHLLSLEDDDSENEGVSLYNTSFCGPITAYGRAVPTSVATAGRSMNPSALPRRELVEKRTLKNPNHNVFRNLIGLPDGARDLVMPTSVATKPGPKDKRARAPRNVVLDLIFEAFKERPQMSTRGLLEVTDQPVKYLTSVLSVVAVCKNGIWMLKDEFARPKARATALAGLPAPTDEVNDEDDDDMEEVI